MPALPAGQAATDRPVRLQALIDLDGTAQHDRLRRRSGQR